MVPFRVNRRRSPFPTTSSSQRTPCALCVSVLSFSDLCSSPFTFDLPALFTLLAVSPERSLEGSGAAGTTACPEHSRRVNCISHPYHPERHPAPQCHPERNEGSASLYCAASQTNSPASPFS